MTQPPAERPTFVKSTLATALAELGGGDEFLEFLDFLTDQGAGEIREWVIDEGARALFSGTKAQAAREWLVELEDGRLKLRLCQRAGEAFAGPGFEDCLDALKPAGIGCQSALLTGFCKTLAMTDPEGAQRKFRELCVPRRIAYSGLPEVMSVVPPTSDFSKLAGFVGGDDKALAKATRTAVLRSWAEVNPVAAAEYVLANTPLVHADQMAAVVARWAQTAPAAAANWLDQTPAGKPRDEGMAALARHWTAEAPTMAWQCVTQVADFELREAIAVAVCIEWEKTNRDAAVAAWLELFPDEP